MLENPKLNPTQLIRTSSVDNSRCYTWNARVFSPNVNSRNLQDENPVQTIPVNRSFGSRTFKTGNLHQTNTIIFTFFQSLSEQKKKKT